MAFESMIVILLFLFFDTKLISFRQVDNQIENTAKQTTRLSRMHSHAHCSSVHEDMFRSL